jgi:hypothetical protein
MLNATAAASPMGMIDAISASREIFLLRWKETAYRATGIPMMGVKWGRIGQAATVSNHWMVKTVIGALSRQASGTSTTSPYSHTRANHGLVAT